MKTSRKYLYLILALAFLGCKPETQKVEKSKPTESKKEIVEIKIPENVYNDFKVFLHYFSKYSIFRLA